MNGEKSLENYRIASQAIYEAWRSGDGDETLPDCFEREHVPEPYLDYGFTGVEESCVFLSTNPGGGMDHQRRPGVAELSGGSLPSEYLPLSRALGGFYEDSKKFPVYARHNVQRMKAFARVLCGAGALQVEAIPWHSKDLPRKETILDKLGPCRLYGDYHKALKDFLSACPVVFSWSAGTPDKRCGAGMDFKAEIMELDLKSANFLRLAATPHGTSQALLWTRRSGLLRGIFVNRGSANLPAEGKFESVATALRA